MSSVSVATDDTLARGGFGTHGLIQSRSAEVTVEWFGPSLLSAWLMLPLLLPLEAANLA